MMRLVLVLCLCVLVQSMAIIKEQKLTKCQAQLHSDDVLDRFVPECTEDGKFERKQCYGFLSECWCVDENGEELVGSRSSQFDPDFSTDCTIYNEVMPYSGSGDPLY